MLAKGGSERHQKMLKPFGLDASKPDFWKKGLNVVKGFVDELEVLTDQLGMNKRKQSEFKNENNVKKQISACDLKQIKTAQSR